jgi:uncharacterized protein YeaO (DUF488 family)
MPKLAIKRVYEPAAASDGFRVLVDRLWPRGLSKAKVHVDLWLKEIAPSDALRKWFGHDPERWAQFQARYRRELRANPDAVKQLKQVMKQHRSATLLFSARDEQHNNAVVLCSFLRGRR